MCSKESKVLLPAGGALPKIYVAFWSLMKRGTSTADSLLTSLLYARGLVWLLSPAFGRDSIVLVTTQLFPTIHYQGVNGNL